MPAGAFVTPLAGGSITQVWKPLAAVGSASDGLAPFALGTRAIIVPPASTNRAIAQFCRVGASGIAAAGTTGIGTDGVTASTGTWTNDTGVALVTGDYVFLTSGITLALADEAAALGAEAARPRAKKENETDDERALREAEEAEFQRVERERERENRRSSKAHA